MGFIEKNRVDFKRIKSDFIGYNIKTVEKIVGDFLDIFFLAVWALLFMEAKFSAENDFKKEFKLKKIRKRDLQNKNEFL